MDGWPLTVVEGIAVIFSEFVITYSADTGDMLSMLLIISPLCLPIVDVVEVEVEVEIGIFPSSINEESTIVDEIFLIPDFTSSR